MLYLPPAFLPTPAYYALLSKEKYATIAINAPFDKRRKETHRYDIADTRGRLTLTVPIQPPHGIKNASWADVKISGHGNWQTVQATTLASAYGRAPFYEYYIDRFSPALFAEEGTFLSEQIKVLNKIVCNILLIDTDINYNCSETIPLSSTVATQRVPYWQIRQDEYGFIDNLSVLDLIFNMGPEAPLIIKEIMK